MAATQDGQPAATIAVRVCAEAFDPGVELRAMCAGNTAIGGVASFVGLVRDLNLGDGVAGLFLEHYPGMTERALHEICADAALRWPLIALRVVHRVGQLLPGEPIVMVQCAAAHRGEALAACEFVMDFLKTRAPFWKRERTAQGERWIEARDSDQDAAARWARGGGHPASSRSEPDRDE